MTAKELWDKFSKEKKLKDYDYDSWSFGEDADLLAHLVVTGQKLATSSLYPLYEIENEKIPQVGDYSVILDSKKNAVCIIKNLNVEIIPFDKITSLHAYKEGEGDKSLDYWREKHQYFFAKCMNDLGMVFTTNMKVVFEEFKVVYKL